MSIKSKKGTYIDKLLRSPKTIFSIKDIALLWGEEATAPFYTRLSKYVKNGKLLRVYQGMYAKDNNYNHLELATRIYTPSYISFETVLTSAGVNFQHYNTIFVASYITREIKVEKQTISCTRMKDYVLNNTDGIEHTDGIAMATKERAFLDRIYISKDYHFDNLDALNWDAVFTLLPIYNLGVNDLAQRGDILTPYETNNLHSPLG